MGLLFIFGRQLEKITSSKSFLLVCFFTGLMGSLTFIPLAPLIGWTGGPVVGASAAVWVVVAAFAAMRPNALILKGKAKHWAAALFIGNAILLFLDPQAMIGAAGIILGVMCGYWLKTREPIG